MIRPTSKSLARYPLEPKQPRRSRKHPYSNTYMQKLDRLNGGSNPGPGHAGRNSNFGLLGGVV